MKLPLLLGALFLAQTPATNSPPATAPAAAPTGAVSGLKPAAEPEMEDPSTVTSLAPSNPTPPSVTAKSTPAGPASKPVDIDIHGDFEKADPANPAKPLGWELSDGTAVAWTDSGDPGHGKAIRMNTALSEVACDEANQKAGLTKWVFPHPANTPIGESYGLSLYSEAFPCDPDKTYTVTFDYRCEKGTGGKLWMRGYSMINGEERRSYEGNVDCGGNAEWKTYTGVFHPTRHTPGTTKLKIMLYAIVPDGIAWYDNVKVTETDDTGDDQ